MIIYNSHSDKRIKIWIINRKWKLIHKNYVKNKGFRFFECEISLLESFKGFNCSIDS